MFELIQDGGFGNKLTIEDGAVLELGRFEHGTELSAAANNQPEASRSENISNERKTTGEGNVWLLWSNDKVGSDVSQVSMETATTTAEDSAISTFASVAVFLGLHLLSLMQSVPTMDLLMPFSPAVRELKTAR